MTKVLNMALEELTLLCFDLEPMLPQFLDHSLEPSELVCHTIAVHNDVIQVHQENIQQVFTENCLHQHLEGGRSIAQSERHLIVLKQANAGG